MTGTAKTMQRSDLHQETKPNKRVFAMAGMSFMKSAMKLSSTLAVMLVFCVPLVSHAQVDRVTTVKDDEWLEAAGQR